MALAWSMDKLGPICRSVGDAAIVFDAIEGVDPLDDHTIEAPFVDLGPVDVKGFKVGHPKGAWRSQEAEARILATLADLGVKLVPVELPDFPVQDLLTVLSVEAAASFDELTRSGRDELLVRQVARAWPNELREARLVPAVEYVRANRLRRLLIAEMNRRLKGLDALVHPSGHDFLLPAFNLTGHPSVCLPSGFREDGTPRSVSFSGPLFGEARLLVLAEAWQRATGHHLVHPNL
jgi:Asp-tRNA(Asn)/Glu-tRNA(Gln) amidotransferase A subunit family amidase